MNVMAMDYGRSYDPNQMGQYAVDAMRATIGQIRNLLGSGPTDGELNAMVGVTPMIGLNDVSPKVFTLSDADYVVSVARSTGVGFLGFWSATRDQPCVRRQVVSPTWQRIPSNARRLHEALQRLRSLLTPGVDRLESTAPSNGCRSVYITFELQRTAFAHLEQGPNGDRRSGCVRRMPKASIDNKPAG